VCGSVLLFGIVCVWHCGAVAGCQYSTVVVGGVVVCICYCGGVVGYLCVSYCGGVEGVVLVQYM
jgi:hypothetical protein